MTSLQHLDLENCTLQKPHPVWGTNLSASHCVTKATIQAQLLIMRYPLYGQKVSGKKQQAPAPSATLTAKQWTTFCYNANSPPQPNPDDYPIPWSRHLQPVVLHRQPIPTKDPQPYHVHPCMIEP